MRSSNWSLNQWPELQKSEEPWLEWKPELLTAKEDDQVFIEFVERIAQLLDHENELLFSMLYRLDVAESDLKAAMSSTASEPIPMAFARLILQRQKLRMQARSRYRVEPLDDWET